MAQTFHTKFFKLADFTPFKLDVAFGGVSAGQVLIKIGPRSAQIGNNLSQVLTNIDSHQPVTHYPLKYHWPR